MRPSHFLTYITLLAGISLQCFSQSPPSNAIDDLIFIQSGNFRELEEWSERIRNGSEAFNLEGLKKVLREYNEVKGGNYENLKVDVVLYDPFHIGSGELKQTNPMTDVDYVENWRSRATGDRVLFFFQKEQKGTDGYAFKRFASSSSLNNTQLPEIITNYIQQVVLPPAGDPPSTLQTGITALKNAFDQQFRNRLEKEVPEALLNPVPDELQPGHANYNFKYISFTPVEENYELYVRWTKYWAEKNTQAGMEDTVHIPFMLSLQERATTANIFDENGGYKVFLEGNPSANYSEKDSAVEIKAGERLIPFNRYLYRCEGSENAYMQEGLQNNYFVSGEGISFSGRQSIVDKFKSLGSVPQEDILTATERIDQIDRQCNHFRDIKKISGTRNSNILFSEHPRNYFCKVRVGFGEVKKGEEVSYEAGQLKYSGFTNNRPTWCNAFAIRLSQIVFGKSPIYGTTADMEPYMAGSPDFIELYRDKEWTNTVWHLISSGYIIYFVHSSDHIEVGFPTTLDSKCTIGGGNIVGKKKINDVEVKNFIGSRARIFLYLGNLKNKL